MKDDDWKIGYIDITIIAFKDYGDRLIPTICHYSDLMRGYTDLKACDKERGCYYRIGRRQLDECVEVLKLSVPNMYTGDIVKWEDRNKLYEKYPMLREKETRLGAIGI